MALDVMTIPAMSADVERLFSDVGVMVSDRRSRLDAMIISIASCWPGPEARRSVGTTSGVK